MSDDDEGGGIGIFIGAAVGGSLAVGVGAVTVAVVIPTLLSTGHAFEVGMGLLLLIVLRFVKRMIWGNESKKEQEQYAQMERDIMEKRRGR